MVATGSQSKRTTVRVVDFVDYLVVFGALGPADRERLCLTHVAYGRSPIGGRAWWPKVSGDE
jgi:hypothetical protein